MLGGGGRVSCCIAWPQSRQQYSRKMAGGSLSVFHPMGRVLGRVRLVCAVWRGNRWLMCLLTWLFCSPVRDGDHSEPGAERWQGCGAEENSGPGCEALPRSETCPCVHEDGQPASHDSPGCSAGGGEGLPRAPATPLGIAQMLGSG